MKTSTALKAIIEKEKFSGKEKQSYGHFIELMAEILVEHYTEKYAKSAATIVDKSTKNVEK